MNKAIKVLLVDDDEIANFYNSHILKTIGVEEIHVAQNGQEALDMLTKDNLKVDLIVLDINMPIMNGFEFLDNFKNEANEIVVVLLSSSTHSTDYEKSKQYSAIKEYLEKPLEEEGLKTIFNKYF